MKKTGHVKFFSADKGFGFIAFNDDSGEAFFHLDKWPNNSRPPKPNDFVEFDTIPGRKGPKAANIVVLRRSTEVLQTEVLQEYRELLGRTGVWSNDINKPRLISGTLLSEIKRLSNELVKQNAFNSADWIKIAREKLIAHVLGSEELAQRCAERAHRQREELRRYGRIAVREGVDNKEVIKLRTELEKKYPEIAKKVADETNNAEVTRRKNIERQDRINKGMPLSILCCNPAIDHRIRCLKEHERWTLLIDDTGRSFDRDMNKKRLKGQGRAVGILIPQGSSLPELPPGTHFTHLGLDRCDEILQNLLDSPVGIFGVTVDDLPPTRGDRWVDNVSHVIEWIFRLLPFTDPTEIEIHIEEHGNYRGGQSDWDALLRLILKNLCETNADRYEKLKPTIRLTRKKDDHPFLAYADAVAHTWGSNSEEAKARRRQSKLVGACLHTGDGRKLMEDWDLLRSGSRLEGEQWRSLIGEQWRSLIHDPNADAEGSISQVLLEQVSSSCREDRKLWKRYLDATFEHLESKAVRLSALGEEVRWLSACKPEGEEILPALELAWRIAELENANHRGKVDDTITQRLGELCESLYEVDPQLVCQAELDQAVLYTNSFDFRRATEALRRWKDADPVVPGLQHWARVQSSFGQHAAFQEQWEEAEDRFVRALEAFDKLSKADKALAEMEKKQTATYRAIAAMDNPSSSVETVRALVGKVVSVDPEQIRTIAGSGEAGDKYAHHLLLRFLVGRGDEEEKSAYLDVQNCWSEGDIGHPWPLIYAYRALLLPESERETSIELMKKGYELASAEEQGPTVNLIGVTLGAIASRWSGTSIVAVEVIDRLEKTLPQAIERITHLRSVVEGKGTFNPLEIMARVLPFNFR